MRNHYIYSFANRRAMKRKYEAEKFPEISELIQSGRYTTKPPSDTAKYTQKVTWSTMRLIYDESDQILPDFFFCSKCAKIYNLKLCNSGKTLKRHVEKCSLREQITDFFVSEFRQESKKIKLIDKQLVKDAAMEFIIRDARPISAINGDAMLAFISKMTYIGATYGHLTPEAIEKSKLLPSRHTVIHPFDIYLRKTQWFQHEYYYHYLCISVYETHRKKR